ncbi:hypothetical protein [Dyadobacter sp. 676]|uniref:Beta-propeller repeat protein n=1 Tax=Dyadobacter sp. 676 TaxID=3088362 RepID=A0AAU8FJH3_9BACT
MVGVVEGDNKNKNIDLNGVSVPANERDGFLAVLDARNGEFQRRSMITGPNAQVPETITVDNEGNAYVAGAFLESVSFSSPDQTLSGVDSVDIFVAKWGLIDTGFLWARRAASARVDFAYDIEVDNDKNVYVTGMHNGDITELSLHSRGDENAYLAKWNAQGKVVAASNGFHNGNRDYHGGIARTKEGNIVLAGSFSSTTAQFPMVGGKSVQGKGVTDIILTEVEPNQLTPTGFLVSDGGAYEDRVNKICITNTGYVYAAGWFKTNSNFNEININGKSDERNTFITRYKLH